MKSKVRASLACKGKTITTGIRLERSAAVRVIPTTTHFIGTELRYFIARSCPIT
jgi:hypothetical protein